MANSESKTCPMCLEPLCECPHGEGVDCQVDPMNVPIDAPSPEQLLNLWKHCRSFVTKEEISCAESVYQMDNVIQNAYEFIEGVCDIVGYHEGSDEE